MTKLDWMVPWSVEARLWQLETTLNVAHGYSLTDDEKCTLRKLIQQNSEFTPSKFFRAISMLLPPNAAGEQISNAIGKVAIVYDAELFRSPHWWDTIQALKRFDSLTYLSERVN